MLITHNQETSMRNLHKLFWFMYVFLRKTFTANEPANQISQFFDHLLANFLHGSEFG